MYFRFNRRYNLLEVRDDFAHLRGIHDTGDLDFEFYYHVKPHDAVKHDAITVRVLVFARTVKLKPVFEHSHTGFVDTRRLIRNIITHMPNAKSVIKQQEEFIVAHRHSDISSFINNEVVGQLRAKVPAKNIQQLYRPVLKLVPAADVKEAAEKKPILTHSAHQYIADTHTVHSGTLDENPTRLMHDMIIRQGIDPSHIINMTHRSVPGVDALGGILKPSRALEFEHSPVTRLLHYHIFPPKSHFTPSYTTQVEDSTLVQVLTHEPVTTVEIPAHVIVPRHALRIDGRDNGHFFVKFELINGRTGVAVDTVIKSLDVARHVQLYYTPRRPPVVKVSRSEISTRANLEIKQIDPGAEAVQIFKKNIYRSSTDTEDYIIVGTYAVKKNQQSLLVQVDLPRNSTAIYRVVPVGRQNVAGFDYTNVVVRPKHFRPIKALSLTAQPIDIGIRLEARQIPQHVVAIEFKRANKTIFENTYTNVGEGITLIDDAVRTADFVTVVDRDVNPGHIYEYVARMVYESGTEEYAGNATIEFTLPVPGKVDTKIQNLVVDQTVVDRDHDGLVDINVTFDITTTIIDTQLDVVKNLLQRQDVYELFKGDVEREREFLKSLIAHHVQRVDLTTGVREDFGVITSPSFSDVEFRKNQAIQPLRLGHRYRYEVIALLRAPETVFESFSKEKIDQVTKKTYSFSPAKFLHPITLNRGVIVSSAGLRTRYAKEAMMHGAIGSVEAIEVSFDNEPAVVIDPSCARFDKYLNILTWKVQGEVSSIDHFVIMKEVHGVRTVIGKAHSEFTYGNCQYLHPVSRRDEGAMAYVIAPVFNNYKLGSQVTTNSVVVEPFPTFARHAPR